MLLYQIKRKKSFMIDGDMNQNNNSNSKIHLEVVNISTLMEGVLTGSMMTLTQMKYLICFSVKDLVNSNLEDSNNTDNRLPKEINSVLFNYCRF